MYFCHLWGTRLKGAEKIITIKRANAMFSTIIVNGNFNITLVVEVLHLLAVK